MNSGVGGVRHRDAALESGDTSPHSKWPHAPVHHLGEKGVYLVTAGTYQKKHHLATPERLELVMRRLFACTEQFGWELHAWSVLTNHYHFIACSPSDPGTLRRVLGKLHMTTAKALNEQDGTPGQKIWFQYWDSLITFERSYLARLNYVHHNPAHHGIVDDARRYPWCSAAWFERTASPAFVKTVSGFKIDRVEVPDDF